MIDLHCHILPMMDDGSQSITESLAMARMAVDSGVAVMAATPHCINGGADEVADRVLLLREALEEEGIPLKLCMGMEIFGTEDTARLLCDERLLTLNGSRYPLIEFSFRGTGERETEVLQDVLSAGFRPVVAHPERYGYIQDHPELLNYWMDLGCLFQVNRGSLLGRFGSDARFMALELVHRGFAAAVASDGHSSAVRTPWMEDIGNFLRREAGSETAKKLLLQYPRMILTNQPLQLDQPEWF